MGELVVAERNYPTVTRYWSTIEAAVREPNLSRAALVPLEALPALMREITAALVPADFDRAGAACQLMLGTYARHDIADVDVWTRAMVAVFQRYPASLAYPAVDKLTDRMRFVPVKADLVEEMERLMVPLRAAHAMAIAMEREHQRRADDQAMNASIEADRKRFREQHGGKSPLEVLGADRFSPTEPEKDSAS